MEAIVYSGGRLPILCNLYVVHDATYVILPVRGICYMLCNLYVLT